MGDCEQKLTPRLRWLLHRLWQEWKQTKIDIETLTDEIDRISTVDERCQRLRQIPVSRPLVSTAMLAAIGNGAALPPRARFRGVGWRRPRQSIH